MAALWMFLFFLTLSASSSSLYSSYSSHSSNTGARTTKPTPTPSHSIQIHDAIDLLKLEVVHRDSISFQDQCIDHKTHLNAQIKQDKIRVAALVHPRLNHSEYVQGTNFTAKVDVLALSDFGGEYLVNIGVGTPSQRQNLILDTGSDICWIQCKPCISCLTQWRAIFDPAASTSYNIIPCNSPFCNLDCDNGQCHYDETYGDASFSKGILLQETITMERTKFSQMVFGCGHNNSLLNSGPSGILGLGGGRFSLVDQLGEKISGIFSYCLPNRGSKGLLEFGPGALPSKAAWIPLIRNPQYPPFYFVDLVGLGVGRQQVPISVGAFKGGVVLDSGTAITKLPAQVYNALRDAFVEKTPYLPRAHFEFLGTCFNLNNITIDELPAISLYFSGDKVITFAPKNFLYDVDGVGTKCLAFDIADHDLEEISILGNTLLRGFRITIDAIGGFVGFGPPNSC